MFATYSIYLVNAFLLSFVAIRPLIRLARRVGLMDVPHGRKRHKHSTPVVGGIAIFLAFVATSLQFHLSGGDLPGMLPGLTLLVLVGIVDDRRNLSALTKLACQTLAALVMVLPRHEILTDVGHPFGLLPIALGSAALPLTVMFIVAVINAFNLIDGIDGLAGSAVVVTLAWLGYAGARGGGDNVTVIALVMISAVLGFLVYNIRHPWRGHAEVFLGDAGSMMLGATVAMMMVQLSQTHLPAVPLSALFWVIGLPTIDMISVMARRIVAGRSPFAPDHRHLHYLLIDHGVTHSAAVSFYIGCATALGAIGMIGWRMNVPDDLLLAGLAVPAAFHSMLVNHFSRGIAARRRVESLDIHQPVP